MIMTNWVNALLIVVIKIIEQATISESVNVIVRVRRPRGPCEEDTPHTLHIRPSLSHATIINEL